MRWVGHVALMGLWRGVHRVLMWKPEGKRPLERPRHRWKDNIKIDLQEVEFEGILDGCGLGLGQVAVTCKGGNEPLGSIKCGEFFD